MPDISSFDVVFIEKIGGSIAGVKPMFLLSWLIINQRDAYSAPRRAKLKEHDYLHLSQNFQPFYPKGWIFEVSIPLSQDFDQTGRPPINDPFLSVDTTTSFLHSVVVTISSFSSSVSHLPWAYCTHKSRRALIYVQSLCFLIKLIAKIAEIKGFSQGSIFNYSEPLTFTISYKFLA